MVYSKIWHSLRSNASTGPKIRVMLKMLGSIARAANIIHSFHRYLLNMHYVQKCSSHGGGQNRERCPGNQRWILTSWNLQSDRGQGIQTALISWCRVEMLGMLESVLLQTRCLALKAKLIPGGEKSITLLRHPPEDGESSTSHHIKKGTSLRQLHFLTKICRYTSRCGLNFYNN